MKQWYESLFENYANKYENEIYTQGTIGECDFLEKEFNYNKELKILDIGCGTGRHAIELAKRGYNVTGIDLSEAQIKRAKEKAAAEGLTIEFFVHDARNLPFENEFDAAIMLCEGGFALMETDEMNFAILKGASRALKSKAKFIFTTLNALFPLFHSLKEFHLEGAQEGLSTYLSSSFDFMTFRDYNTIDFEDDAGEKKSLNCNERYYTPPELTWMLKSVGFTTVDIFGAKLGEYSRDDKLTTEDFEMLAVAEK